MPTVTQHKGLRQSLNSGLLDFRSRILYTEHLAASLVKGEITFGRERVLETEEMRDTKEEQLQIRGDPGFCPVLEEKNEF